MKKYNVSAKYSDSDFTHNSLHALYIPITVHDSKFFFCVLLAIVLRRLQIVRAHETKVFATKGKLVKSQDKFEALSDKANLYVSKLYIKFMIRCKFAPRYWIQWWASGKVLILFNINFDILVFSLAILNCILIINN